MAIDPTSEDRLLTALGEQLAAREAHVELVVIGGAALIALGYVARATADIDAVALLRDDALVDPEPLPAALVERAIAWPPISGCRSTG